MFTTKDSEFTDKGVIRPYMSTPNQEQLNSILRAIIEEPDVDLHRLAYADYLEEHQSDNLDSMEHAALIRKQLGTEEEYLFYDRLSGMKFVFKRGFVEEVTLTYQEWIEGGVEMVQSYPLKRVWTSDKSRGYETEATMYRNYQCFKNEYKDSVSVSLKFGVNDLDDDIWNLLPPGSEFDIPWWKSYRAASSETVRGYLSDAMLQWAKNKALQSKISGAGISFQD